MDMQDKEFDKLFRSELDAFEAEPTGQVWGNIVGEMDGKQNKKPMAFFLSIAATIVVLVAAGMLFIPRKGTVVNQHPGKTNIAKLAQPVGTVQVIKGTHIKTRTHDSLVSAPATVTHIAKVRMLPVTADKTNPATEVPDAYNATEQPVLAAVAQKREVIIPVVPDNETQLTAKQEVDDRAVFITKPALAAGNLPVPDKQVTAPVKARHRIHTLGGFLNEVIAKVDKRKDKIIEFTDNDEDESNITAVNLGIIKFKREKDK